MSQLPQNTEPFSDEKQIFAQHSAPSEAGAELSTAPRLGNPKLSRWQLTSLLILLAIVPTALTVGLWMILPKVSEGKLPVEFTISGMPAEMTYYDLPTEQRPPLNDAKIEITNRSNIDWTQLNVMINRGYEVRDPSRVVKPGETVVYRFDKFYNRSGFTFDPELAPISHLRIFARQINYTRASIHQDITPQDYGKAIVNQVEE